MRDQKSAKLQGDILAELAAGTGGKFIENNNDLTKSLHALGEAPEAYYLLGFSAENLKPDGAFHSLKVRLKTAADVTVQARLGYYAPTHIATADEEAEEEISGALFSHEEIRKIPVELNTRLLRTSDSESKLSVMARVGVANLPFRKLNGRNVDDVLVVCALFDRNGNYLEGVTRTVQMRLPDDTPHNKLNDGISVRSEFKVPPGTYLMRVVVRDSEGKTMSARNGAVEIP